MKTREELKNSLKDSLNDSIKEKRRKQLHKWLDAILDYKHRFILSSEITSLVDRSHQAMINSIMLSLMWGFNDLEYRKDFNKEAAAKRLRFLKVQLQGLGYSGDLGLGKALYAVDTSGERKVAPETTVPDLKLI